MVSLVQFKLASRIAPRRAQALAFTQRKRIEFVAARESFPRYSSAYRIRSFSFVSVSNRFQKKRGILDRSVVALARSDKRV
jgi:hypothetical protein